MIKTTIYILLWVTPESLASNTRNFAMNFYIVPLTIYWRSCNSIPTKMSGCHLFVKITFFILKHHYGLSLSLFRFFLWFFSFLFNLFLWVWYVIVVGLVVDFLSPVFGGGGWGRGLILSDCRIPWSLRRWCPGLLICCRCQNFIISIEFSSWAHIDMNTF